MIFLFQDVSGWKLRKTVRDLDQRQKRISCILIALLLWLYSAKNVFAESKGKEKEQAEQGEVYTPPKSGNLEKTIDFSIPQLNGKATEERKIPV